MAMQPQNRQFLEGSWFGSFPEKIPSSIAIFSVLTVRVVGLLWVRVSGQLWTVFAAEFVSFMEPLCQEYVVLNGQPPVKPLLFLLQKFPQGLALPV